MTSDVKLSLYFLLMKLNRDVFVLNTQIIQEKISKHHPLCECRKIVQEPEGLLGFFETLYPLD